MVLVYEILNGRLEVIVPFRRTIHSRFSLVICNAGRDTKLMQNSGKPKFKRTKIDHWLNKIILGVREKKRFFLFEDKFRVDFCLSLHSLCDHGCLLWILGIQHRLEIQSIFESERFQFVECLN